MIFDFIEKFKGLFADKSKYGDQHISMGRKQEYLNAVNTIAVGYEVDAQGNYSTALGTGTEVNYENQVAIGKYNIKRGSDFVFMIGNGTSDSNRANVFEVQRDGHTYIYDDLNVERFVQCYKLQASNGIWSSVDVECTGEGGVGTVSMRALNNKLKLTLASQSTDQRAKAYNLADGRKYVTVRFQTSSVLFEANAGNVSIDLCDLSGLATEFRDIIDNYQFINRHNSQINVSYGNNKIFQVHQIWIENNILKARVAHSAGTAYQNIWGISIDFYSA